MNDTFGHPTGDSLLRIVAARLRHCVSETDVIARTGGDEFVILLPLSIHSSDSAIVAQRVIDVLRAPYDIDGHRIAITVSVGIAEAFDLSQSPDLLLKNADIALYKAKGSGRATFRYFQPEMEAELFQRRRIETDLAAAHQNGEFKLVFQPVFAMRSRKLVGFEALLRWHHPERGSVPPSEFIPVAEDTGLIVPIGAWVLAEACAVAALWPASLKVSVNLSAVQFGSDLASTVTDALVRSGLRPELLELEITESTLIEDNEGVLRAMRGFKGLGIRTSLDDFGTGYSSLSYLRTFPLDTIKIDRSFVIDICEREESRAIIASIVQLAAALGMTTTLEGVETAAQISALRDTGCDDVQGFFFGYPEPAENLHKWFESRLELVG